MAKNFFQSASESVEQPSYGLPEWAQRPQAQPVSTGGAVPFQAEFLSSSQKYGVPFNVLMGLAEQESTFNPTAIGVPTKYGRAKGLMQYIDSTAARIGINAYDPVQSIDAAARQLRERLDKGYSMQEAVQAHFGGDDRKQWGPKTAQYGKDVLGRAEKFLGGGQSVAAGQPTQQGQEQPQTAAGQIAQDYPPAQSAMENMDQTRQRTQAMLDEMNKEEPGRYRILTDDEMQQLAQHITPEMQQQAMTAGKPIEINIPDLVQPGQTVKPQQTGSQPQEKRQAELKSWEPTLWERIKGLIPGDKDAATVEMIARDIANREGVSVEEVYKSMGGARPMWNPEGRAPIQALTEGAQVVGKQLPNVPSAVANATLRAVRGGDISADGSTMMDRAVSATNVPQEESPDPNYQSLNGLDQSLGFSVSNMVPSIAAGAAGNVVSPGVGTAAGFATSGTIAYRASKDQFLDDVKKKAETEKGSKLTEKEWDTLKDSSEAAAMKYGAWEAIPEALSNVIALKMISRPLVGATRTARIADAARRLGKEQAAEQLTETATTLGQNDAEREVGLTNEKMSVADAFRQQAIQTALVSGIQGGSMQVGRAIYDRVRGNQSSPTEGQPADETVTPPDTAATEPVQEAQPEQAAEQPQEMQPSGPLGRAVQNGVPQAVNDVAAQAEQNAAAAEIQTPDEFMGPVGSETTVHPADDPNDSFPAVVQGYRDGNAIVVDEHGEILEFGPHEVVRPDAAADIAQQQPAQEVTEPVQQQIPVEQATEEQPRQPKAVSEMTEPELRDRLKYLHQQAKSSGGWNERLTKARREVEKAIDSKNEPVQTEIDTEAVQANGLTPSENRRLKELLNKDSRTQAESDEATRLNDKSRASMTEEVPQTASENTVGTEGITLVHGSGNGNLTLDDIQIVRAEGQKQGKKGRVYGGFYGTSEKDSAQAEGYAGMMEGTPTVYDVKIKPGTKVFQKEGDITRLSESTINDLVSKGYGVVVGTDPRGRTEYAVIDKNAIQGISQRGNSQEQAAQSEEQNPTLNKDGSQKWFGTERKATEYLEKKGIIGTHEVRQVDRRFEIHPTAGTLTNEGTTEKAAPTKGKNGPRYNRVKKLLGAEEGNIIAPQEDIGYTRAGRQYRIDKIEKNGIVHLTNLETNGGTTVSLGELERAKSRKSGFNRVESVAEAAPAAQEQQQTGQEWQAFDSESGTLGIPRAEMPQVKAEHRGPMVNFLAARGVTHREGMVPADTLKPTQAEFSPERVARARESNSDRSILVSSDGYVLDGHHQWLAAREKGDNVKAIVLDAPIRDLLPLVHEFPSSLVDTSSAPETAKTEPETTESAPNPTESATDVAKSATQQTSTPEYGASNKLVSQDRAAELRKKLKAKFSQLNSGLDPEILAIGTELAVFHIEAGVRKFADFARAMSADLDVPISRLRPYLRGWFNGARDIMEDSGISIEGMDSHETVRAELAKLDQATVKEEAPAQPAPQVENQAPVNQPAPASQTRNTSALDDMVSAFDNEVTPNVSGTRSGMESDSRNAEDAVSGNESTVLDGSGRNNRSDEQPGQRPESERSAGQRDQRVSEDGAASRREPGNQPIHQPDGQFESEGRAAGDTERSGSRSDSQAGSPVEQQRRRAIADNAHAAGAGDLDRRLKAQKAAKGAPTAWADKASIDEALPLLLPEQRDDVLKIEQRHQVAPGILVTNGTGTGKAQPLDAKILTPTGWALMGDMKPGSEVITVSGEATRVLSVHPQGEKDIYRVTFNDGASTECCEDHLWLTQTLYERRKASKNPNWNCAKPKVRDLKEIMHSLDKQHFIPLVQPVVGVAHEGLLSAYTIGVLLGDGNLTRTTVTICNPDMDILQRVADELPADVMISQLEAVGRCATFALSNRNITVSEEGKIEGGKLQKELKRLGILGADSFSKFIPNEYLRAPVGDRIALLQGLMDTDGYADHRSNSASYTTVSPDLRDGLAELVQSLGGTAITKEKIPTFSYSGEKKQGKKAYTITVSLPNSVNPFSLPRKAEKLNMRTWGVPRRKIVSVELVGVKAAQCIAVEHESHLYVTDNYILTHNTASGLGAAQRYFNAGKKNIAIVVPTDKVASDWVKFAGMLDMPLHQLNGIDDAGTGPIVTTYANFGQNDALYNRQWDLIIPDESHYLSSNAAGDSTAALDKLRGLTNHPDGFQHWLIGNNKELHDQLTEQRAILNKMNSAQAGYQAQEQKVERLNEKWRAIEKPARQEWQQRWTEQRDIPKVVFLSATPFAYVKNTDYAEGYLFNHTPPVDRYTENSTGGYNSANDRERFYMEHFGYRMRYNKLTQPEAGVNTELMEQNFNQWLKDIGALMGRRLDVPFDYDRRFQLIDDAAGKKLDDALRFLNEAENGIYRPIYDEVMRTFDYQRRMFLLESMKARAAVPIIRQHLALGRKVVVFHDYNKGGGFSPFAEALTQMKDLDMRSTASELFQRPMFRINFSGLDSAINTISQAFPKVLLFNGTVPKGTRRRNADFFNSDKSGKNLILVQSDAGREGVSLHDTTGKHQRVEINLGMPVRPVAATQIEGRIYRTGQASDAVFRYMTTGTSWEASTFASKIAERAATAENLALGTDARGLKQSFIDAYNEAEPMEASREDGKGGKERDKVSGEAISPFDRAKTFYYAQQKNTKRRDQREGQDYFATPEPVGFKMVEWANIKPGDKVLEPSAGHGAIARFFPEQSEVTMVEPSYDLSQRAALSNGTARIVNGRFEDLSRANKYDAIVMNPPFGTGGKTAYEHLAKAAKHLRQGGRIVALVPRGGLSERRFDQFFGGEESKGLHLIARVKMPWSTFERAGIKVATEVLVFERHDKSDGRVIVPVRPDLSSAENVNELFDRIEGLSLPDRQPLTADEAIANAADGTMYSVPEKGATATAADVEASSPVAKELIDSGRVVTHDSPPAPEYANAGGWIDPDGKIHLGLYNLKPEGVQPTLMHELFHAGMRNIAGDRRWVNLMDRLGQYYRSAQNGGAKNEWSAAVERIQNAQNQGDRMNDAARDHVIEELGAYAVENFEKMPAGIRKWAESIIGAVKNFLQQTMGLQLGKVTPAQLRALAAGAIRNQTKPATSTSFSTPPSEEEKQKFFDDKWDSVADLPDNTLKTIMPAILRATPFRFMLKRVAKDIPSLSRYADVKLQMDTLRDEWHAKTDQEAQKWLKYRVGNSEENTELMSLMHDSTLAQNDPSKDFISILNGVDLAALREKKRGDPAFDAATEKAQEDAKRKASYAPLKARYDALSPEGKRIYNRIRDLYSELATAQEQVIIDNMEKAMDIRAKQVRRQFDDEMQRIQDEGLKGKEKDDAIEKAKKAMNSGLRKDAWNRRARINQLRSEFESNRLAGPYFPLARFGDFFVTARKKGSGEVVSFSRMESAFAQSREARRLKKEGYDVEVGVISQDGDLRRQVPADFVARVEDLLKGIGGTEQMQDQIWQLYLQTMPDFSLRKNRIHRKGRAGFEEDALRAFANHMFHGSHQLARMKYNMELGDLIDEAAREAKKTRSPVRSGLVVEQARRNHAYVMNPTSNRISQTATQGAFIWYMAGNVSSAIVNMAQTVTVAPSKLALLNKSDPWKGYAQANIQITKALFDLGRGKTLAAKSPRVTGEEKLAIEWAYRIGLITRTQSHDVAGIGDSGIKYTPTRARLMKLASFLFHHTERINREATFLAAYRMAKKQGMGRDAGKAAAEATWASHYDYQNTSRPAIMHGNLGKTLLALRSYNINMIADLAYTTYEAINPRDKKERQEALVQMTGLGLSIAFNAGIRGLPLYGLVMTIANMFTDDGEDPETELKKFLQRYIPVWATQLMFDGVPGYGSGTDISPRIGFGDLWFRSDEMDREGADAMLFWGQQILGATSSIPVNIIKGIADINDGYTWRGMEKIVPSFIKNPMKAYRYYDEGVATKDGDPIVDEVGGWDIFKQALGFTPARVSEQYKLNNGDMRMQKAISDERTKLLGDFYKAWKKEDEKKQDEIIDKMRDYSQRFPEKAIKSSDIQQSLKSRERRKDQLVSGVRIDPKLIPRLEENRPEPGYR